MIVNYRRYLKRRNYSSHTVKNYLNTLRHYVLWLDVPIEQVTARKINAYIDHLLSNRREPKTITAIWAASAASMITCVLRRSFP